MKCVEQMEVNLSNFTQDYLTGIAQLENTNPYCI